METKEFCMNMDLMISSKYNTMLITMVSMMISNTPHLEINPKYYLYPGKITKISV